MRTAEARVTRMRDTLRHRGPDDAGLWADPAAGIVFGFRRLSIMDPSPAGHQPMRSADGRFVVIMNGEIYNSGELRAEVSAARPDLPWRGHSDTEALVEAIALWGVEAALRRTNGMFAVAAWDCGERTLSLARDRIGEKPLYLGWAGGDFVFGSELKALRVHPELEARICPTALAGFLQVGYLTGPATILAGVTRLPAGHLLRLGPDDVAARRTPPSRAYWSLREAALAGLEAQRSGAVASEEELEALLGDAVARRMVADVPVGAFLSGGVDSSLVTALMAERARAPVYSFAIGFDVPEWDEAPHARGGGPSRHPPRGDVPVPRGRRRRGARHGRDLRRAARRRFRHSHHDGLPSGPPARHRGAVRRRR
jgi:asparagine synthase (glutamine-hydrolysing)